MRRGLGARSEHSGSYVSEEQRRPRPGAGLPVLSSVTAFGGDTLEDRAGRFRAAPASLVAYIPNRDARSSLLGSPRNRPAKSSVIMRSEH